MSQKKITVYTENPEDELWKKLLQYTYKARIKKFFSDNSINVIGTEDVLCETIIGSLSQAHEYFCLSKSASLHTSPLLLYYGTVNLFLGASTLLAGKALKINNHGMKAIPDQSESEIGRTTIHFCSPSDGGIHVFNRIVGDDSFNLTQLEDLSIKALRKLVKEGRIPSVKIENKVLVNLDLILETLACYNIGSDSCALFSERRNKA